MKLKCPNCGSNRVNIITSDDENQRYSCEACSRTGNRELFTASDDNENDENKEFWT